MNYLEQLNSIRNNPEHDKQRDALLEKREAMPEFMHPTLDKALDNLEMQVIEPIREFLSSEEVVNHVNILSTQLTQAIDEIGQLREAGLLTSDQEAQAEIERIIEHEEISQMLAIVRVSGEYFDETPYKLEFHRGTASAEVEAIEETETHQPETDQASSTTSISNDPIEVEKVQSVEPKEAVVSPNEDGTKQLEIIEVSYDAGENKLFVNGVEVEAHNIRTVAMRRMVLAEAIARHDDYSMESTGAFFENIQRQYADDQEIMASIASSKEYRDHIWMLENIVSTSGEGLIITNGSRGRGTKIGRNPLVGAEVQVVGSHEEDVSKIAPDQELTEIDVTTDDPELSVDTQADVAVSEHVAPLRAGSEPTITHEQTANLDAMAGTEESDCDDENLLDEIEALPVPSDRVKLATVRILEHLRDELHFRNIGSLKNLTDNIGEGTKEYLSRIGHNLTEEEFTSASELLENAIFDTEEYFALWDLANGESQPENLNVFIENLSAFNEFAGFITSALIEKSATEIINTVAVEAPEDRRRYDVEINGVNLRDIFDSLHDMVKDVQSLIDEDGVVKQNRAVASTSSISDRDIMIATSAGVIKSQSHANASAIRLSVRDLMLVNAYKIIGDKMSIKKNRRALEKLIDKILLN